MCGIRVLGGAARPTCGASMAWPHGSVASRRRDDARARATGPSRRGATAAAATGLDAARRRRASAVRCLDGAVLRLRESRERARAWLRDGVVHAGHSDVYLLQQRRAAVSGRRGAEAAPAPGAHVCREAGHAAPETSAGRHHRDRSSGNYLYPLLEKRWRALETCKGDRSDARDGKFKFEHARGLR